MNKKIEFKKDYIMKSYVSEIVDISITHDYKILEDTIEGVFDIEGLYKVTKSSIDSEPFNISIPFTIAMSSMIDKDTIEVSINDFKYELEKDIIHLYISLDMKYEEIEIKEEDKIEESFNDIEESFELEKPIDILSDNKVEVKDNLNDDSVNTIVNSFNDTNDYAKYKVYIMRGEDSLESVAVKYNTNLDIIKEYNDVDNINIGDKIIIPIVNE